MNTLTMILSLAGGIGLFLYGMSLLGSSLQQVAGGKLEQTLEKLTNNKLKAFLLGTGVTAVIQSSGATTIMLVGFVNAGIMKIVQAIPVMMGANIGTTMTAQILRLSGGDSSAASLADLLKPSSFAPILVMAGAFVLLIVKRKKTIGIASIFVGFGILFMGMSTMETALAPLKESKEFVKIFTMFSNPFLAVVIGILVTTLLQSSSASVGLLQALSSTGVITFGMAAPIIIGENIGKTVPVMIASIGTDKNAKRLVLVDLMMNLINGALFLIVIYGYQALIGFSFWGSVMNRDSIANFHSLFNIVMSLILLPFTNLLAKQAERIIPVDGENDKASTLNLLDPIFVKTPALALDQCKKVVDEMAEAARENLATALQLALNWDDKVFDQMQSNEHFLDKAETMIGDYLVKINAQSISKSENRRANELLHSVGDFERIGDMCVKIANVGSFNKESGITFTNVGRREIDAIGQATVKIMDMAASAFENESAKDAARVQPLEEVIDALKELLKNHHIERLQDGTCGVQAGISFLEIINSLERISDHCSSIGIYVMQRISGYYFTDKHSVERKNKAGEDEYKALYAYYKQQYYEPVDLTRRVERQETVEIPESVRKEIESAGNIEDKDVEKIPGTDEASES